MELGKVILLSVLEGLTEFIPVSSTGHMIIVNSFFGSAGEIEKFFEVFIQLGAVLAVMILYRAKIMCLCREVISGKFIENQLAYSPLAIVVASLPTMVVGFLFYKKIKLYLFSDPRPVAIALIVGGIGLILVERFCKNSNMDGRAEESKVTLRQALIVGLFQCFSLWPGMSRSGSCIIGARLAGVSRIMAAEFSFIVALPLMLVAVGYDISKNLEIFLSPQIKIFLLGFVIAFFSGAMAIKVLIAFLQRFSLVPFGGYRIILGVAVLVLHSQGLLTL